MPETSKQPLIEELATDIPALAEDLVGIDGLFPRDGRLVVALLGLSPRPAKQTLEVDGRTLYAWCAGDVLYIHDLLGRPLRARSGDPITGEEVSISLKDGRVREVEPSGTVFSWAADFAMGDDVIPDACGPINFFGSEASGRALTDRTEGIVLLTLEQGLELMRLTNQAVFGSALADDPGDPHDMKL